MVHIPCQFDMYFVDRFDKITYKEKIREFWKKAWRRK